jgi:putative protease
MRRQLVDQLGQLNLIDNPVSSSSRTCNELSPSGYAYPYLYNISNRLSQEFYKAVDLTAYELKGGDGPLMQCRHCVRYALGYCVRRGGRHPEWKEPLYLQLGDGRRFRLEFDCKNCQMNVYA